MRTKQMAIVLASGLSSMVGLHANAGATLDRVNHTHVLVAVMDKSYPPFVFLNAQNQLDGFDVDVVKAVAKRLGAKLKIETPAWEAITAGHWNGRWDICACSMTPDKNKAEVLNFPAYYYSSPAVVIVNAANHSIKSGADIQGKKIGIEGGSSYERYLQRNLQLYGTNKQPVYPFKSVRIAPYDSEEVAFQDLSLGDGVRIDAVISNYATAKLRLERSPGKFKVVGRPLYDEPNWVAVDKGDPEWNATVARIIKDFHRDGTLAKISKKWIGSDITK
jgi:polar amino acid transport system substrate-binding protein